MERAGRRVRTRSLARLCCSRGGKIMAAGPYEGHAAAAPFRLTQPEGEATRLLYERHQRKILAFCQHQLRNREEAEDATQITFMNAFRGLKRGTSPEFESAWLYKIRSEEHTSELQSHSDLVCRLLLEKKKTNTK